MKKKWQKLVVLLDAIKASQTSGNNLAKANCHLSSGCCLLISMKRKCIQAFRAFNFETKSLSLLFSRGKDNCIPKIAFSFFSFYLFLFFSPSFLQFWPPDHENNDIRFLIKSKTKIGVLVTFLHRVIKKRYKIPIPVVILTIKIHRDSRNSQLLIAISNRHLILSMKNQSSKLINFLIQEQFDRVLITQTTYAEQISFLLQWFKILQSNYIYFDLGSKHRYRMI